MGTGEGELMYADGMFMVDLGLELQAMLDMVHMCFKVEDEVE